MSTIATFTRVLIRFLTPIVLVFMVSVAVRVLDRDIYLPLAHELDKAFLYFVPVMWYLCWNKLSGFPWKK